MLYERMVDQLNRTPHFGKSLRPHVLMDLTLSGFMDGWSSSFWMDWMTDSITLGVTYANWSHFPVEQVYAHVGILEPRANTPMSRAYLQCWYFNLRFSGVGFSFISTKANERTGIHMLLSACFWDMDYTKRATNALSLPPFKTYNNIDVTFPRIWTFFSSPMLSNSALQVESTNKELN